eukprot:jgi/Mesen1/4676/ME000241S03714
MSYSRVFVLSALAIAFLAVLPSLIVGAEAKFTFQGAATDILANRRLVEISDGNTIGQEAHSVPPPGIGGHHPPGTGHHPPGAGGHGPGVGRHPPNEFGVIPGHHPGKGHHPPGQGHHPPGVGHRLPRGRKNCLYYPDRCSSPELAATPTCCSKSCVNLLTDVNHCGTCNTICADGDGCCSGSCTDFQTNNTNCGSCGVVCPPGINCVLGTCNYGAAPAPSPL